MCELVKQVSTAECVVGSTFGCVANASHQPPQVWVTGGCRGTFRVSCSTVIDCSQRKHNRFLFKKGIHRCAGHPANNQSLGFASWAAQMVSKLSGIRRQCKSDDVARSMRSSSAPAAARIALIAAPAATVAAAEADSRPTAQQRYRAALERAKARRTATLYADFRCSGRLATWPFHRIIDCFVPMLPLLDAVLNMSSSRPVVRSDIMRE